MMLNCGGSGISGWDTLQSFMICHLLLEDQEVVLLLDLHGDLLLVAHHKHGLIHDVPLSTILQPLSPLPKSVTGQPSTVLATPRVGIRQESAELGSAGFHHPDYIPYHICYSAYCFLQAFCQ